MKESAQAALTYVRTHSPELGLEPTTGSQTHDIHIHVPAGGDPQGRPQRRRHDGHVRSGSLITGTPVRNDVAMTGEITLTGQVLPIGGLKEKSLAAQRAGHQAR